MKKLIATLLILATVLFCAASCTPDAPKGTVALSSMSSHDDVQAKMLKGEIDIAILPEPKATVAISMAKASGQNYSIKLNVSEEWDKISDTGAAMGCIAVNNSFIQNYERSLVDFLAEYKASIEYVGDPENHESAVNMIVDAKIVPKPNFAKASLTNLYGSIVYQDGNTMKNTLVDFYDAIGQEKPADSFYYIPDASAEGTAEKIVIGIMNGPTGMGMAKLISEKDARYEFVTFTSPQLALAALQKNEIQMACIPTNAAANLANKSGSVSVAAINCLGSLYVVAKDEVDITSVDSLIDKTVYFGEKTSTTAPIISYILKKNNIEVTVDGE